MMTRRGRVALYVIGALSLLPPAGCTSVPSQNVATDRMDYGTVVAESWKRQTLLNVVRLRYADAPVFLDVASIINSYTVGGNANAQAQIPSSIDPNVFEAGATRNWSNTPTVTYQPLIGDRFTRSLLTPISPASIFQLLQGGWPATLVLQTVVGSINGLRNGSTSIPADPRFVELTEALFRIQRRGDIGIRVDERGVLVVISRQDSGAALSEDRRRVRQLLGLDEDVSDFQITYGLVPRNRNEVAVLSRSMMEIMLQLGFGIDLPPAHVAEGRILTGQAQPGDVQAKPLVHVHSGSVAPADAYASVPYKGYWYWIADSDIESKRTFTFLMMLFSLAETGQSAVAPVVTVPAR
jgi:hypothetical protein